MLRRRKEPIREALALTGFEERSGQPGGLVGVQDLTCLYEVAGPEDIVRRRSFAIIGDHAAGGLAERNRVPKAPSRHGENLRQRINDEILRRLRRPIEEGVPDSLRLLLIEALERH